MKLSTSILFVHVYMYVTCIQGILHMYTVTYVYDVQLLHHVFHIIQLHIHM